VESFGAGTSFIAVPFTVDDFQSASFILLAVGHLAMLF
jgi:hypothetical protein